MEKMVKLNSLMGCSHDQRPSMAQKSGLLFWYNLGCGVGSTITVATCWYDTEGCVGYSDFCYDLWEYAPRFVKSDTTRFEKK